MSRHDSRPSVPHGQPFGPWRYTCRDTGRLLTHDSGYVVHVDALKHPDFVELAIGHVARKPWAMPGTVARLRDALVALGLAKQQNGRAA